MGKYTRGRGPYVGHTILQLDNKHRLNLNAKVAEKIKQRSKNNVFYLYACYPEDMPHLRMLKFYDEEFYQSNAEEIHPGGLEEIKLQANDRLQIPLPLYNFLNFNNEHRYAMIIADRTGNYYHIYNVASITKELPENDEFGDFLPSFVHMASSCDLRLKKYLSLLTLDPHTGAIRDGYEWMAEFLLIPGQVEGQLPNLTSAQGTPETGSNREKKMFETPPYLPSQPKDKDSLPPF